jgi:hypothetical protein
MAERTVDVVLEDGEFIDTVMGELIGTLPVDYMVTQEHGPTGFPMVTVVGFEVDLLIFHLRYTGDLQAT